MRRADEAPEPSIEVDVDAKYIVELLDLSEAQSQWPDAKDGDISLTWKYRLFDMQTGAAVIDNNNGFAYELWQFSNDKTYRNVKSGKAAKAREWAEALVGKGELTDDQINEMIDAGFGQALKGKRALADLEWYTTAKGYERLKIIRLRPLKKAPANPLDATTSAEIEAVLTAEAEQQKEARKADAAAKAAARKLLGLDEAA